MSRAGPAALRHDCVLGIWLEAARHLLTMRGAPRFSGPSPNADRRARRRPAPRTPRRSPRSTPRSAIHRGRPRIRGLSARPPVEPRRSSAERGAVFESAQSRQTKVEMNADRRELLRGINPIDYHQCAEADLGASESRHRPAVDGPVDSARLLLIATAPRTIGLSRAPGGETGDVGGITVNAPEQDEAR